jgi:thymidylate synthase (FAD)
MTEIKDKYIPVLDHGFVALVDYMGGDDSIERAARVSYGKGTRKTSDQRNLLRYLISHRHTSPLEQCVMTFHIAMPVVAMRQFVRHRTARLNEYSGRYSEMPQIYYTANQENCGFQSTSNKQGRADQVLSNEDYQEYLADIAQSRLSDKAFYQKWLNKGLAKELARNELPLSIYTYMYWQIDLHNLFHLLKLRLDPHAQYEIREYARVLAGYAKEVAPICFEAFEDYILYARNFSCYEMDIIKEMARGVNLDVLMQASTLSSREKTDFLKKLESPTRTNFTLNFSKAREASYYEQLVQENL